MTACPERRSLPRKLDGTLEVSAPDRAERLTRIAILLCVVAGTMLRLMASRSELWLDEVWSLNLVAPLSSPDQVFWAIPHDNNHLLNSLWLYLLGPDRQPMLYRLPAVACGSLSILVAARVGLKRGAAAGMVTALLVAFAFPFVNYGSEARGYAGLILAMLVCVDAFEDAVHGGGGEAKVPRAKRRLAVAIAFGTLCHFTMLAGVALLAVAALVEFRLRGAAWSDAVSSAIMLFRPTLLILVPIALLVGVSVAIHGGLVVGDTVKFSWAHCLAGLDGLLQSLVGTPAALPPWLAPGLVSTGLGLAAMTGLLPRNLRAPGIGALVIPALMALAHLPNLEMPRYFLTSGVVFVIILGTVIGRSWERGGSFTVSAAALLALSMVGQAGPTWRLLVIGRGSYAAVAAMISTDGGTYAADAEFRARVMIDFASGTVGPHPLLVSATDTVGFCRAEPRWFIADADADDHVPEKIEVGPEACRRAYRLTATFPTSRLSGRQWGIFHDSR